MLKLTAIILVLMCTSAFAGAQQNAPEVQGSASGQQPNVRVNYLNVCAPSETDEKEIAEALATIPLKPPFAPDFEVSRGRSTMSDEPAAANARTLIAEAPVSSWVRIRHEFEPAFAFSNAQYSFSVDERGMTETLVLRRREASKTGVLQISVQDSVTAGTPAAVLATNTPADRIRIERSGKASVVLARCPAADQVHYEPLFRTASQVLARYRVALSVQQTVPADLARVGGTGGTGKRTVAKPKK